jgi:2-C-methyl-D-erythritol 4-phosphate cytidylyltransferase
MGGVRKQYLEVQGQPVLLRAIRPFLEHPRIGNVVVVLPPEDVTDPPTWLAAPRLRLVAGGSERSDSVWNGLRALPRGTELVLVHDGARPFVTREIIDRVLERAPDGGAVAALPATDTIKQVRPDGRIERTLPRARIWQAQTPQGFPLEALLAAYERARAQAWVETDDSTLVERAGGTVSVVMGAAENIKITRPADLPVADAIARFESKRAGDHSRQEG